MWYFFYSHYRDFPLPKLGSSIEELTAPESAQRLTLVHFIDSNCQCNRYSLPHIHNLKDRWPHFRHIELYSNEQPETHWLRQLQTINTAYPAVALFGVSGRLIYYGPYTSGFKCGEGEDNLAPLIEQALEAEPTQWVNVLGYGCFCGP